MRIAAVTSGVEEESDLLKSVHSLEENVTLLREECKSGSERVAETAGQTSKLFDGLRAQLTNLVDDQRAIRNQLAKHLDTMTNMQAQMVKMHQIYEKQFSASAAAAADAAQPQLPS